MNDCDGAALGAALYEVKGTGHCYGSPGHMIRKGPGATPSSIVMRLNDVGLLT